PRTSPPASRRNWTIPARFASASSARHVRSGSPCERMTAARVLFVGDLVGKAGLRALAEHFDHLVDRHRIDFTIVNVQNASDGRGVTPEIAEELFGMGMNCLTSGNHIWDKKEIREYLPSERRLLRPANYPPDLPGSGLYVGETPGGIPVAVVNIMGRVFMPPV